MVPFCKSGLSASLLWLGLSVSAVQAQTQSQEKPFDIPAGPAPESVMRFARQSGWQILANSSDLDGIDTPSVRGKMAPETALARLLAGTPLTLRRKGSETALIVRQAISAPVPEPVVETPPALIVVTGFRRSYADAVQIKRTAVGVSDAISSDGLGRFPDLNIGEAAQRITGVQINREADARSATVNLRGLPGTYARITINGQAFADPVLDSSTPLGAFHSDIFTSIRVVKTLGPGDASGGLSGNMDLEIQPALSRKPGGQARLSWEYNDLGKSLTPAFSLGYNARLSESLGLYATLAYKRERFRRDSIVFQYTPLSEDTADFASLYADYYAPYAADGTCRSGHVCSQVGTGRLGQSGVLFPSDIRQVTRYNSGRLFSTALGGQYRRGRLTFGISGFFTQRRLDENHLDLVEIDLRPKGGQVVPQVGVARLPGGTAYVDQFSFATPQVNLSSRSEPAQQQAWSVDSRVAWASERTTLTGTLVTSRGRNVYEQTQIDWRTAARPDNRLSGTLQSGGPDIADYRLSLNSAAIVVTPGPWQWLGPANASFHQNAQGDQIVVSGSSGYADNRLDAAQFDARQRIGVAGLEVLSGGVRFERTVFASEGYRTSAKGIRVDAIDDSLLSDSGIRDFFGGVAPGHLTGFRQVDFARTAARLRPLQVSPSDQLNPTGWINDPYNTYYASNNFTVATETRAVFLQGEFQSRVSALPLTLLWGTRHEATQQVITTLNRQERRTGEVGYQPATFTQTHSQWLPSVQIRAGLRDDLVLRLAAYKTFSRPQPRNLSPATSVSATSNGYAIVYGGYDLRPYTSNAQDLSLEWYNRPGSLVSLALFRKRITNLIALEWRLERLCPADATAFGLGHLRIEGGQCLSDQFVNGQPAVITASGNFNQDSPLTVDGLELSVQQTFDFLPGAWRYLGGVANLAYTRVAGRVADGTRSVLPGVSERTYNLIGYYETPRFGVRVVYNYRDEYTLAGVNTFFGSSSRVKSRGQVDASASYRLKSGFTVSLDAFNLSDARRSQFQSDPRLPRVNDYDGRTLSLNVRAQF